MKLTVLGKYGPYAAAGGATSSYLVCGENTRIVLDFGSGALSRLCEFVKIDSVDAIVLSHLHYDHICDLLPLSYLLKAKSLKLKLLYPEVDCFQRKILGDLEGFELVPYGAREKIGEFELSFAKMVHPLESYSIRVCDGVRTLFYSGDTAFCEELCKEAAGSDLLLLDCGKREGSAAPHLSLSEAEKISETLGISAIASHLNPETEYESESPLVTVARERETYEI